MLQSFMRMRYIPMLRNIAFKEFFCFFDFPDAQSCGIVNWMLKKNRHKKNLRFIIAKIMEDASINNQLITNDPVRQKNFRRNKQRHY